MKNKKNNDSPLVTASTMIGHAYNVSMSAPYVNTPASPSMINYVPFSISIADDTLFREVACSPSGENSSEEEIEITSVEIKNERDEEMFRTALDEAGPWITHRLKLDEWDQALPKPFPRYNKDQPESFDGVLTKDIIAPNLSRVDRCPELQHYAYTKCVLTRKKLTDISALQSYHYLQYLDVSSNKLTTLKALGDMPFLKILDASHNSLKVILDFKAPFFLTTVNLSHNKIKKLRDISAFWSITDLNLSHNGIKTIEGLQNLKFLSSLNLSFNKIITIENLHGLRIQFLDLRNNLIRAFEDDDKAMLYTLNNIRSINFNNNQISSLKLFENVKNLESLEISNNNISTLLDIYYLRKLKYLNKLNLSMNPVTDLKRYEELCITLVENIRMLDGEAISFDYWLKHISHMGSEPAQVASANRLNLLVLEQFNPPAIWHWVLPYDNPPLTVIILVGLQASNRAYIGREFCSRNSNVVIGIPYTTKEKYEDEVEGQHFYYVNADTFNKMLKDGKFLAYEESLGNYFGIAHEEFKKAENGIIMFYATLPVALAIKREFINTVLVLAIPSSREVHMEKLSKLYSVRHIDKDTIRIMHSPLLAKEHQREFEKIRKDVMKAEAETLVQELVSSATTQANEVIGGNEESRVILPQEENYFGQTGSIISTETKPTNPEKGDMVQIWWSSVHNNLNTLSMVITPSNLSSTLFRYSSTQGSISSVDQVQSRSMQNFAQIKRYVSFGCAEVIRKGSDYTDKVKLEDQKEYGEKGDLNVGTAADTKKQYTSKHAIDHLVRKRSSILKSLKPLISNARKILKKHKSYADALLGDPRMQAVINEELLKRDELVDLHFSTPGLFREVLFTDENEESMQKLDNVVKDILKHKQITRKAMIDFERDQTYAEIIDEKIKDCFNELQLDMSTSDQQASEYMNIITQKGKKNFCPSNMKCIAMSCPPWK